MIFVAFAYYRAFWDNHVVEKNQQWGFFFLLYNENNPKNILRFIKSIYLCSPLIITTIGSIAQLVQSTCLTSRGSQVRTLLLPQKNRSRVKRDSGHSRSVFLWSSSNRSGSEGCESHSGSI